MRKLFVLLLYCATLMSFSSCKTSIPQPKPIEIAAPDSLPDPLGKNGWEFVRTSPHTGVYVPPQATPKKVKYKNVGNTEILDKSVVKDKSKAKQGSVKDKSKVKAKDAGVIGNGNEVKQEKGIPYWVIYLAIAAVLLFQFWPGISRWGRRLLTRMI